MKDKMTVLAGWTITGKQNTNSLVVKSSSWNPKTSSRGNKSNKEKEEMKEKIIAKGLSRKEVVSGVQFTRVRKPVLV